MDWEHFVASCPEIAELAEQRFRAATRSPGTPNADSGACRCTEPYEVVALAGCGSIAPYA